MENEEKDWGALIGTDQFLSPRHRRLAELAASGKRNVEIAKELDYSEGRVSVLLSNSKIQSEVRRIQDRVFEESVGKRMKQLGSEAMDAIEACIRDNSRANASRRNSTAIWLLEQLNGRATQRHEVSTENNLGSLMDKLDALKAAGKGLFDSRSAKNAAVEGNKEMQPDEEDPLEKWTREFCNSN